MKGCRPGKLRLAKVSKRRINCQSSSMREAGQSANLRAMQFVQAVGKKYSCIKSRIREICFLLSAS